MATPRDIPIQSPRVEPGGWAWSLNGLPRVHPGSRAVCVAEPWKGLAKAWKSQKHYERALEEERINSIMGRRNQEKVILETSLAGLQLAEMRPARPQRPKSMSSGAGSGNTQRCSREQQFGRTVGRCCLGQDWKGKRDGNSPFGKVCFWLGHFGYCGHVMYNLTAYSPFPDLSTFNLPRGCKSQAAKHEQLNTNQRERMSWCWVFEQEIPLASSCISSTWPGLWVVMLLVAVDAPLATAERFMICFSGQGSR